MPEISTKPYLIRAIYEWCSDSGFTPYINVRVDQNTKVPVEYVKNGEIVLNLSASACRNLTISNEIIQFSARFNGVSREIAVPLYAVQGIFSRENGKGAFFEAEAPPADTVSIPLQSVGKTPDVPPPDKPKGTSRGNLRIIK